MEVLIALEERIMRLIDCIKKLKGQNNTLLIENDELKSQVRLLEGQVKNGNENTKELAESKFVVDGLVDDLIKHIDVFVESGGVDNE